MKIAAVIARYLAGVIFLVMGLYGFLSFIPFPPPREWQHSSWAPSTIPITCG